MQSPPATATKPISPPPVQRKSNMENGSTSTDPSTSLKQGQPQAQKSQGNEKHGHGSKPKGKAGAGKGGGKQLTHFLCLPLVTPDSRPQLQQSLQRFRDTVGPADSQSTQNSNDGSTEGERRLQGLVPEGSIRPLGALHLTIGVMSLSSFKRGRKNAGAKSSGHEGQQAEGQGAHTTAVHVEKEEGGGAEVADNGHVASSLDASSSEPEASSRSNQGPTLEKAIQVLQSMDLKSLLHEASRVPQQHQDQQQQQPLTISLRGVHTFSPKKTKTSILFANPHDPTSRLYPFARSILSRFIAEGLIQPRGGQGGARGSGEEELVLHATIVNTTYAKGKNKGKGSRGWGRGRGGGKIEFDAMEVMSVFNEQGGGREGDVGGEFVWADGVVIDRVVICEMGAKKVEDDDIGMEYVRVAEKMIL